MLSAGSKIPLVLLHGWGVNSRIWQPLIDRLTPTFEVTMIDLPGYGDDRAYVGDHSLTTIVDRVLQAAPPCGLWIAWSLGATIAMDAALRFPERIMKLQLISPTPRFMATADWPSGMKLDALRQLEQRLISDYETGLKRFLMLQTNDRSIIREQHAALLQTNRPSPETLKKSLQLLAQTDLRERLDLLKVETQILIGEHDRIVSPTASRWIAAAVPHAELISFGMKTGHLCFLEQRERFLTNLQTFAGASPI